MTKAKTTKPLAVVSTLIFVLLAFVCAFSVTKAKTTDANEAKIGETEYATLQEAIESANDNEIVLLKDVNLEGGSLTIVSGKKFTLNLNGKTISGASAVAGHSMISNKGEVTITGEGKITYAYTGAPDSSYSKGNYTIVNSGVLTLESGTIENTTAFGGHMHDAIDNNSGNGNAIFTINGGAVLDEQYIAIRQFANSTTNDNKVIINGGIVRGGKRGVWVHLPSGNTTLVQKASIEVTDGTVESMDETKNQAIYFYSYGSKADTVEINISGGTINGSVEIAGANSFDYSTFTDGNIEISGGEINSVNDSVKVNGEIEFGFVTGGTFSSPVSEEYCANGFVVAPQPDGNGGISYGASTVVEGKDNAKASLTTIKDKYYTDYRYNSTAKTTIDGLVETYKTAIDDATTSTAINTAVTDFETALKAVEVIPLADYKATAISAGQARKTTLLAEKQYEEEDKALMESLYTAYTTTVNEATTYAKIDEVYNAFINDINSIVPYIAPFTPEPKGLGAGMIALIVILGVLVVGGIAVLIVFLVKKSKKTEPAITTDEYTEEATAVISDIEEVTASVATDKEETVEIVEPVEETVVPTETVIEEETVATVVEEVKQVKPVTFEEKLAVATEKVKENYDLVKQAILSYAGITARMGKRYESYRVGRYTVIKVLFAGKNLKYCFALDPKAYDETNGHTDASDKKTYQKTPLVFVVNNKTTAKRAVKFANDLANQKGLKK